MRALASPHAHNTFCVVRLSQEWLFSSRFCGKQVSRFVFVLFVILFPGLFSSLFFDDLFRLVFVLVFGYVFVQVCLEARFRTRCWSGFLRGSFSRCCFLPLLVFELVSRLEFRWFIENQDSIVCMGPPLS